MIIILFHGQKQTIKLHSLSLHLYFWAMPAFLFCCLHTECQSLVDMCFILSLLPLCLCAYYNGLGFNEQILKSGI